MKHNDRVEKKVWNLRPMNPQPGLLPSEYKYWMSYHYLVFGGHVGFEKLELPDKGDLRTLGNGKFTRA